MSQKLRVKYVGSLPDLMTWEDYEKAGGQKKIRLRLSVTSEGLEILGDSPYPQLLEKLLEELGADAIDMMLCG